ncbi:MAG TPA: PrsW family intramembrane metalloprotease [Kofleriaceae bacterium]|nr:PrsW family intramembrane metalloprotease [Kofleriaceae bacterium]
MSNTRALTGTELGLVAGLLLYAAGAYLMQTVLGLSEPMSLSPLLSLVLAAIPAILWLVYFYLQDSHEPEPKHYVAGVYLLGALVSAQLSGFVLDSLLAAPEGIQFSSWTAERIVYAIGIAGVTQELAKYVVVRYTIYRSPELDEPLDGIIYMTAAGIGFATAENVHYLQGLDGSVFLGTGVINTVVTTLAHASFAGVLGFAMGIAKLGRFSPRVRAGILAGGLGAAAVLNGVFHLLEDSVRVSGLDVQPWHALWWAALFAAAIFAITLGLIRRQRLLSPHRSPSP